MKKVKLNSVAKYSSTKLKASWTNINGETGYQIRKMKKVNGNKIYGPWSSIKSCKLPK